MYRVPDTTSKFPDFCFLINSGMNFGCKQNRYQKSKSFAVTNEACMLINYQMKKIHKNYFKCALI
jgi:hypothetical protein